MDRRRSLRVCLASLLVAGCAFTQVIEYEAEGRKYQTLTRNGVTVMFSQLPAHVRQYSVLQVAVSNGSRVPQLVKPEDFVFRRADGSQITAVPANSVIRELVEKAGRGDVIRLVTAYESSLYGATQYRSTNGYEERRRSALAEVSSARIKAAAAASAIAFVQTKLAPGESTDGAVFWATEGKPLGNGTLEIRAANALFQFSVVSSN